MRTLESLNLLFFPLGMGASRQIIGCDRDDFIPMTAAILINRMTFV